MRPAVTGDSNLHCYFLALRRKPQGPSGHDPSPL